MLIAGGSRPTQKNARKVNQDIACWQKEPNYRKRNITKKKLFKKKSSNVSGQIKPKKAQSQLGLKTFNWLEAA